MNSKQRRQTRRKSRLLRGAMRPAPGRRYIDADYSAIEFRVMAMVAESLAVDVDTNNWWQEIDSPTGRRCGRLILF